jgi:nucleotide-binding universal stress UspA family protein
MEREEANDLQDTLGAFEGAFVKKAVKPVTVPQCAHILLAVDRSNQDKDAIELTTTLAKRWSSRVSVIFADGDVSSNDGQEYAKSVVEKLASEGLVVEAEATKPLFAAHQILAAQTRTRADLIVMPAPYMRDVGLLGDESLSSVVDVLIAEAPVPVLLLRYPQDDIKSTLMEPLVAVTVHLEEAELAAGWAFKLMDPAGHMTLLAVADPGVIEAAAKILGHNVDDPATREATLRRFELGEIGGITAAVQKHANATGQQVTVEVKVGHAVRTVVEEATKRHGIVCMGAPVDRTSEAYGRAVNIILRTKNPVLVT